MTGIAEGMQNLIDTLGDQMMSRAELVAVQLGFPPLKELCAVITPADWNAAVAADPEKSLIFKATDSLQEFCGDTPNLNLLSSFGKSAADPAMADLVKAPSLENDNQTVDNPFILKPPTPSRTVEDDGSNNSGGSEKLV